MTVPIKPIPFSPPMVRAIDAGRKTMTRRVMKPQPLPSVTEVFPVGTEKATGRRIFNMRDSTRNVVCGIPVRDGCAGEIVTPYAPGDLLWIREAWRTEARFDDLPPRDIPQSALVSFEADYPDEPNDGCRGRLRPGMFLPRWASRLTLEVTGVKVQRLQEISEADARAEGVEADRSGHFSTPAWRNYAYGNHPFKSPVASFRSLWDSLNAKRGYGWEANPWVAAYSFHVHRVNVDDLLKAREAA